MSEKDDIWQAYLKAEFTYHDQEVNWWIDRFAEQAEAHKAEKLVITAQLRRLTGQLLDSQAELTSLRDENERLNDKFACGHRKIDWDDSYGECVFCKIKAQANDYEKLPLTLIGCHDEIEDLRARLEQAEATWSCGCGWRNGCNLAVCACCGRTPHEGVGVPDKILSEIANENLRGIDAVLGGDRVADIDEVRDQEWRLKKIDELKAGK